MAYRLGLLTILTKWGDPPSTTTVFPKEGRFQELYPYQVLPWLTWFFVKVSKSFRTEEKLFVFSRRFSEVYEKEHGTMCFLLI